MKQKTFTAPIVLKADGQSGEFTAIFATLNVIDHDGDVTIPGAFREQPAIVEPWNHSWNLPAGKGVIKADNDKVWIEGQFFLDTEAGRENYQTVKNLGDLAEWSYTFNVLEQGSGDFEGEQVNFLRKLDVVGVSPVTRGAGINTQTVNIKGQKGAIASHTTATTDAAWDGPANESRLPAPVPVTKARNFYAWWNDGEIYSDDAGVRVIAKQNGKFGHHMVSGDGTPGAANIRACQTGIGVLNGGRGGTTIPGTDRQGVYNHLAKHLRDADVEPPELKSLEDLQNKSGDGEGEGDDAKPSGVDLIRVRLDILEIDAGVEPEEEN